MYASKILSTKSSKIHLSIDTILNFKYLILLRHGQDFFLENAVIIFYGQIIYLITKIQ